MPRTDAGTGAGAKLKILMLLLYYYPHPTGLTYLAQVIAEGLARRGHEVTVLVARHSEETPLGESMHNGVRVVRLWAPIRISRGFVMPTYPWRLYRLLRQHDVVAMFTPMFESALGAFLARIAGLKIVASHTSDLILPKSAVNNYVTAVMSAIFSYMARRSACIISLSADYADNSPWLAPFLSKVRPVYPPIAIPEPDVASATRLRERLRLNDGPLIGFSGRFVEEKRPELLIKSLDVINAKYPDARIVFTGQHEIPYEDTWARHRPLMERFSDQLEFLGLLETKQELANFYAACDVFVLPSDSEGFAMVQVEAMLCGTPVVMTDIPGGRVAVQETGMGKLARPGDWRSIGETILEVLDNRDRFVKPREKIAQIFSVDDTLDKYEATFREFARR
ncbi:MAG: glycosyltransferase family 4 protein [Chloroflexi bacterium]|nr:glycosyltransferase family 4 protein [Chloroflexota bacterium]